MVIFWQLVNILYSYLRPIQDCSLVVHLFAADFYLASADILLPSSLYI